MLLATVSGARQAFQLIEVIILFVFVLFACYYTTRFVAGFQKGKLNSGNFEIIDTMRLTQNKVLQIIRVGDKYLAIALCKDTVSVLCELSADEVTDPSQFTGMTANTPMLENLVKKVKGIGKKDKADTVDFENVLKDAVDKESSDE